MLTRGRGELALPTRRYPFFLVRISAVAFIGVSLLLSTSLTLARLLTPKPLPSIVSAKSTFGVDLSKYINKPEMPASN